MAAWTLVHVWPSSVECQTVITALLPLLWYETQASVPRVVTHGRSAPVVSSRSEWQPVGPVAVAGQRVTETPSWTWFDGPPLKMMSRSASRIVPADVTSTSASPSPRFVRPLPWIGRSVSIGPKNAGGVSPK